jgi:hypothetical protein
MLLIEVPGRTGHILLQPAELESEIDFDTRSLGSHQRMKEKSASVAAKASAEKAAYEETYGFADQLSPRSRARAIAALNKVQGFNRKYMPRKEAILGFVKQGAKIDHEGRFGRVLRLPSGSFWTEKDLTKTGMDFAAYMISSSGRRGRGRRAPTGLCFPFVLDMAKNSTNEEFFDKSNFQVVHGDVWDVAHGRYTPHAWVEKGGRAFDWQTRTFRPEGWEIQEFRDYYRAKNMVTYTAEEVTINCIRTGHQGPWEPHERAKGRGPLPAARRRR